MRTQNNIVQLQGQPYTVVDAFTTQPFCGNPAAVVLFDRCTTGEYELNDDTLQAIAEQFNITETAFLVPSSISASTFRIRWFAPKQEILLCGHASLASAYALFNGAYTHLDEVSFLSKKSGTLKARRIRESAGDRVEIELPAGSSLPLAEDDVRREEVAQAAVRASRGVFERDAILDVRVEPSEAEGGKPGYREYVVVVLDTSVDIKSLDVQTAEFECLDPLRLIILTNRKVPGVNSHLPDTRPGYYIRVFCPLWGVPEDPVCGSANCLVAGYWAERLEGGGSGVEMASSQVSRRGGELGVIWSRESRTVRLRGNARVAMRGEVMIYK